MAAEAARTFGRRLRARRRRGVAEIAGPARTRDHTGAAPAAAEPPRAIPLPQAPAHLPDGLEEPGAPDAELDALRGALVRELDRLAADDDCSASFRRAG
jgi:hypothetical protein